MLGTFLQITDMLKNMSYYLHITSLLTHFHVLGMKRMGGGTTDHGLRLCFNICKQLDIFKTTSGNMSAVFVATKRCIFKTGMCLWHLKQVV